MQMSDKKEIIQIVAFGTNSNQTPNEILQILLDQYTHTIIEKSKHAISFTLVVPESIKATKIMMVSMVSISNLNREYTGITDVNSYLIFVDLQNENSKENLELILSYYKNYCDLEKKIFVLGIVSIKNDTKQFINKQKIKKMMNSGKFLYEYNELNLENLKEVKNSLLKIFVKSYKEGIEDNNKSEKNGNQAHLCNVF